MKKILLSDRSLQLLFGPLDENARFLEDLFGVTIQARDSCLSIDGEEEDVSALEKILVDFSALVDKGHSITNGDLKSAFKQMAADVSLSLHDFFPKTAIAFDRETAGYPQESEPASIYRSDSKKRHRFRNRAGRHGKDVFGRCDGSDLPV